MHLDELFMYETRKIARIRDKRLGLTYYGFVFLICCYVVGYQILMANEHFRRRDVVGTARMTIQQPTKRCNPNKPDCKSDFNPLTELPYCDVYAGDSNEVDEKNRHKCIFADQHALSPRGMLEGNMLVPTRIDTMKETKGCDPSADNGYTCDNQYNLQKEQEIVYVADIERYTILVAHTARRGVLKANNQMIQGYLMECEVDESEKDVVSNVVQGTTESLLGASTCKGKMVKKPIHCISDSCHFEAKEKDSFLQQLRGRRASEKGVDSLPQVEGRPHWHGHQQAVNLAADGSSASSARSGKPSPPELAKGGIFSIPDGDIFSIAKLLELSGLSLDKTVNKEGEPLREAGTVIEIEAIYSNLRAWLSSFGFTEVSYYYKISQRPMEEMKTEMYAVNQPNFPAERLIENRHGLYITVKIGGEFGFFSIVYLLVMLTTAVALIGVASIITDKLMIYVMERKDEYLTLKYDYSERMTADDDELSTIEKVGERFGLFRRGNTQAVGKEDEDEAKPDEAKPEAKP